MKPYISTSSCLLILFASSTLFLTSSTTANTSLNKNNNNQTITTKSPAADIQKACSTAKDKPFCVHALTSNPKSRGLNLKDLSFLAMTMAQENGTETLRFVSRKLGDENELQPSLDECLGDCEDLYEDAVAMLENAISAFFSKGKGEVTKWLSTAMADGKSCEDGLKTSGAQGVMGNRNQVFYKLVSNAWSVYDAYVDDSKH